MDYNVLSPQYVIGIVCGMDYNVLSPQYVIGIVCML